MALSNDILDAPISGADGEVNSLRKIIARADISVDTSRTGAGLEALALFIAHNLQSGAVTHIAHGDSAPATLGDNDIFLVYDD